MAAWSIGGFWAGRYWYDPNDAYATPMPTVSYTLTLSQGWFGRFHGYVQDDASQGGMPERGVIEGRIRGLRLSFVKKMPLYYVVDGAVTLTLRQYLRDRYQMDIEEDVPHPGICYEGEYDPETDAAKGSWLVDAGKIPLRSRGQLFETPFSRYEGKWEMKRQGAWGRSHSV